MLPHQEEIANQILQGNENYIYCQGGVGSAKTLLWAALAAAYMIIIPGCRIILCRKDFSLLYDTLWRYFKDSIQAAHEQGLITGNFHKFWKGRSLKATSYCELPNNSWARAVQLKSLSEVMGPNYDGIFISDAMENENFGFIFRGEGTVGGLQSRLRGQVSSFYTLPNGTIKDMRRFLIESNPPPNINELHSIFGKDPGVRYFPDSDIRYRHIQISSVQNDHNPPTYLQEISSQHSDPNDIKRILGGKTIAYYGGVKVIPKFISEIHVSHFDLIEDLPLFVSIDPGTQHPAVIISQIRRCDYGKEHYIRLSEITNIYDKTTHKLVELHDGPFLGILAHLALFYPSYFDYSSYKKTRARLLKDKEDENPRIDYRLLEEYFQNIQFCIDRGGNKKYSTNKDRETDRSILLTHYGIRCRYRNNIGLDKSLDRVNEAFDRICLCNVPEQMIDQKCEMLIDGYSGGYRYAKFKDGSHSDKPIDDHRYEDPADADRYGLENFFFHNPAELYEVKKDYFEDDKPWAWMERT